MFEMKRTRNITEQETRARLLEAAGRAFAERGFRGATVRDICTAAGANVAAINYHFGDKSVLYAEAIRHWAVIAGQRHPLDAGLGPKASPEDRLRAFILAMMRRLLDEDRPSWHGQLMAREMAEPTAALDTLVREFYQPVFDSLCGMVGKITGRKPGEASVTRCAFSILGQCLYYYNARHCIERLRPRLAGECRVEELAGHIADFSLLALGRLAGGKRTPRP